MSEQQILEAPAKLIEFNAVESGLTDLRKDLSGVQFDVTTTAGDKAARAARQRCVSIRTSADAAYGDWNKPMLEKQREMRAKLGEIKEAVKEVEEPIDQQIKAEEARKADEKVERERIEAERLAEIQADIDRIKNMVVQWSGKPSQVLFAAIEVCESIEIALDRFGDRAGEAEIAKQQTLSNLQEMHTAAAKHEAEQAQLAADRAELKRQQEAQLKEAAEARAKADADEAKHNAEIAEQQAALKAQQDEIDRQKKEIADAQFAADLKEKQRQAAIEAEAQEKKDVQAKAAQDKADAEAAAAQKKADEVAAEAARRERVQFEENGPGQDEIIAVLANHYQVSEAAVSGWLTSIEVKPSIAA